jgi:sirohydrochlorin ferrochelatase
VRAYKIPLVVLIVMLSVAGAARAQLNELYLKGDAGLDSGAQPARDSQTQAKDKTTSQEAAAVADDNWHLIVSPYLWFPGVHGTLGLRERTVSIHASPGDLLSNFRIGLMGTADLRRKRLLLPFDIIYMDQAGR